MADPRAVAFAARAARTEPSAAGRDADPVVTCRWQLDVWLTRVRWAMAPLCLILVPLFPIVSGALVALLALALALGNTWLALLLRAGPTRTRLRLARPLATVLEWTVGLGMLALFGRDADTRAPAVLVLLVLLTGARYGLPGVVAATPGALLALTALVAAQAFALEVLASPAALRALVGWSLLVVLAGLITGAMARAAGECSWVQTQRSARADAIQWTPCGLSPRELMLLPWLARAELTYQEIGGRSRSARRPSKPTSSTSARSSASPGAGGWWWRRCARAACCHRRGSRRVRQVVAARRVDQPSGAGGSDPRRSTFLAARPRLMSAPPVVLGGRTPWDGGAYARGPIRIAPAGEWPVVPRFPYDRPSDDRLLTRAGCAT